MRRYKKKKLSRLLKCLITIYFLAAAGLLQAYLETIKDINKLEGSIVDFDMAEGRKKIGGLEDFSSELIFSNTYRDIKSNFQDFDVEEQEKDGDVTLIRFKKGFEIRHEFLDFDQNGKYETWKKFKDGLVESEYRMDEKEKIILEETLFDKEGSIKEVRIDENKKGYFSELNFYDQGKITKTVKDLNGDSLFEEEYLYYIGTEQKERIAKMQITSQKLTGKNKVFFAGFYHVKEKTTLDEKLTDATFNTMTEYFSNTKKDIETYKNKLKEGKSIDIENDFPNRFDFFNAIANVHKINLAEESKKNYILLGNIYERSGKVSIYFRLIGPEPVKIQKAGSIHFAGRDFSSEEAASQIREKLVPFISIQTENNQPASLKTNEIQ
ncbi:MAG: hypothetical protein OEZ22_10445 [Spirochaetia bacterium]|nr:hypothetical protein [Spirochaetia bacterium]